MQITDIADNTIDKDGIVKRRTFINYPRVSSGGKAENRINGFIIKIVTEYKKDAAKTPLYTYNRLKYKICCEKPLSVFFESERMGADGLFSYAPFSVTFSKHGYAVPLLLDKITARGAKRFFAGYGIRLSHRDIKYSYYKDGKGQTVIYAKIPSSRRAKRGVIEYRAPSFVE